MDWISQSKQFGNPNAEYVKLDVNMSYYDHGLEIQVIIWNTANSVRDTRSQPFPHFILGSPPDLNLKFVFARDPEGILFKTIESNVGLLSLIRGTDGNFTEEADLLVSPGSSTPFFAYLVPIKPDLWAMMKEVADRDGVLELVVSLSLSLTLRSSAASYDFKIWQPYFTFILPRMQLEEYLKAWAKAKKSLVDVPRNLPPEVLRDVLEASRCLDIEAPRAGVAMIRRALEGALIDKGAKKTDSLADQIDDLENKKLLTKDLGAMANALRFLGNYGVHPDEDALKDVTLKDAQLAYEVLSRILRQLYS